MKKAVLTIVAGIIMAGCLAKEAKPYTYYELKYNHDECVKRVTKPKNIYIDSVMATNLVDRRDMLIVDWKNRTRYAQNAKFITMPSDMLYKALNDAVFSKCGFNPIFVPNEKDLRLKAKIITLGVYGDEAVVMIGYEILDAYESMGSGIVTKKVYVPDPSNQSVFDSLNKSLNLAIDEILKDIL